MFKKKKNNSINHINTDKLGIYLDIFNSRKGKSSYFEHYNHGDVRLHIRGNEISGFVDIYYKDIHVVDMCIKDLSFLGWTRVYYNPCKAIVDEINQAIDVCVKQAKEYINKMNEEKRKQDEYAKKVLGISN